MQTAYQKIDMIFLNPTKVDSPKKDLWLFFYDFSSANKG
jgi:hypothetical protein